MRQCDYCQSTTSSIERCINCGAPLPRFNSNLSGSSGFTRSLGMNANGINIGLAAAQRAIASQQQCNRSQGFLEGLFGSLLRR